MDWDVFNGDADGLLSLHQLRLEEPREARRVTGVKRDIALLQQVHPGPGDRITALDISLESNHDALSTCLETGAIVQWFDHHRAGKIPSHLRFEHHIDLASETCTGLIVDRFLEGRRREWAIAAAYGDNLPATAAALAPELSPSEHKVLRRIGETLNYNAYGADRSELNAWPEDVYADLHGHVDPYDYVKHSTLFKSIEAQKHLDEKEIAGAREVYRGPEGVCVQLVDSLACRRLSGIYGNQLAQAEPELAHAILTQMPDTTYRISIRAPFSRPHGADNLAIRFPGGGGRAKAAGINALPANRLQDFIDAFRQVFKLPSC